MLHTVLPGGQTFAPFLHKWTLVQTETPTKTGSRFLTLFLCVCVVQTPWRTAARVQGAWDPVGCTWVTRAWGAWVTPRLTSSQTCPPSTRLPPHTAATTASVLAACPECPRPHNHPVVLTCRHRSCTHQHHPWVLHL